MEDDASYIHTNCKKYTIEEIEAATDQFKPSRKIGEGGYGPVYKCHLNDMEVAIKTLRPDASQGQSQFNQEVYTLHTYIHNTVIIYIHTPRIRCAHLIRVVRLKWIT